MPQSRVHRRAADSTTAARWNERPEQGQIIRILTNLADVKLCKGMCHMRQHLCGSSRFSRASLATVIGLTSCEHISHSERPSATSQTTSRSYRRISGLAFGFKRQTARCAWRRTQPTGCGRLDRPWQSNPRPTSSLESCPYTRICFSKASLLILCSRQVPRIGSVDALSNVMASLDKSLDALSSRLQLLSDAPPSTLNPLLIGETASQIEIILRTRQVAQQADGGRL